MLERFVIVQQYISVGKSQFFQSCSNSDDDDDDNDDDDDDDDDDDEYKKWELLKHYLKGLIKIITN